MKHTQASGIRGHWLGEAPYGCVAAGASSTGDERRTGLHGGCGGGSMKDTQVVGRRAPRGRYVASMVACNRRPARPGDAHVTLAAVAI
jgi:hypothetical protein